MKIWKILIFIPYVLPLIIFLFGFLFLHPEELPPGFIGLFGAIALIGFAVGAWVVAFIVALIYTIILAVSLVIRWFIIRRRQK